MSAVQMVLGAEVARALIKAGCRKVVALPGPFDVWATDWGFHFTIPTLGDDKLCPKSVLAAILAEIDRQRP